MALMAASSLPALSKNNGSALKPSIKIAPRCLPSTFVQQRTAKPCGQTGYKGRTSVCAQYNSRENGVGDFLGGFFVGGLVFGALGYLLAPQISKNLWVEEGVKKKVLKLIDDGEEGLEVARKSLSEKIAQLNSAIDGVSDKLKADKGIKIPKRTVLEQKSTDYI